MKSWLAFAVLLACSPALAAPTCRNVEVSLKPIPRVQMAVWVEDASGKYIDTLYVTRLTGSLGLANRPGIATFKSDYRFPYGPREMVMPVWAHVRGELYNKVVMGGAQVDSAGNRVGDTVACAGDCRNDTIGYHYNVSSPEPFFCAPSGGTGGAGLDATSCASSFYGCKGAYLPGGTSYYPPRADLVTFLDNHDSVVSGKYASANDLGAVSGATPPGDAIMDPPVHWMPTVDGSYVMKIEVSSEYDFNAFHDHPQTVDGSAELASYGLEDSPQKTYGQAGFKYGSGGFGQPSVVYAVPFTVGATTEVDTTVAYVGYGDWDGATGTMHAPDTTITDGIDGTGVGRLLLASDASGSWRVKVRSSDDCSTMPVECASPSTPINLVVTPGQTSLAVSFASAATGAIATRYDVRYSENGTIDDKNFLSAIPPSSPPPSPGAPGSTVTLQIEGLRPTKAYTVAVRAISSCDAASAITSMVATTTQQKFTTLHGCFIATAAYGSPLADEVDSLRHLRDRYLLTNPLGRVFVATYYSLSPPLANVIAGNERLRSHARALVAPLVEVARGLERLDQKP